jgi:hypothetical protein
MDVGLMDCLEFACTSPPRGVPDPNTIKAGSHYVPEHGQVVLEEYKNVLLFVILWGGQ